MLRFGLHARLGDRLGAIYTPVALALAILAWAISGEAIRFLAVLVIATPCPLLIGIPIIIGMVFAATGQLTPVAGAISQEVIDVLAVLNALRAAFPPRVISDL